MKRVLLIIFSVMLFANIALAQEVVYLIGTSSSGDTKKEGLLRNNGPSGDPVDNYPSIHFDLVSKSKKIEISFAHYNFNLTELAKIRETDEQDVMEIITKPTEFLETIDLVDIDELIATMTQAQAWAWANTLKDKKIYIIDRRKPNPVGTVELIQVEFVESNEPERINIIWE